MNFAEVITEHEQCNSRSHIFPLAAKGVRQSSKASHSESYGQIHPFDMACANQVHIGITDPGFLSRAFELSRTVAGFFLRRDVNLDQLCKINASTKAQANSMRISVHAVSSQLKASERGLIQFLNKHFRILASTTTKMPSKNQFTTTIYGEKCPAITLSLIVWIAFVSFFAVGISPQFIGLYFLGFYFADMFLQELFAFLASDFENAKYSRDSGIAQSRSRANRTAFSQAVENTKQFLVGDVQSLNRLACSFRKRALAVAAFESWSFVAAKVAVKIGVISAVIRASHSVTKSFLTETLDANTITVSGLDWCVQRQSWFGLARCYQHLVSLVEKLVAGIRVERMKPWFGHGLLGLQPSAFSHSASPPLIQRTLLLLTFNQIYRFFIGFWRIKNWASGWDVAIEDAEIEILKAKQRIDALRLSVASFKEFKASNEPFPVTENQSNET